MDTIIESQRIARRRRPYSPISRQTGKKTGLLGHITGDASRVGDAGRGGSRGPAPLWFEDQDLARRASSGVSPLQARQKPAKRVKVLHQGDGPGRAIVQGLEAGLGHLSDIGRRVASRISGLLARNSFGKGVSSGSASDGTGKPAASIGASPANAGSLPSGPSSRAERSLHHAILGLGLAFLILAVIFAVISVVHPYFPLPKDGLLPAAGSLSGPAMDNVTGAAGSAGTQDGATTALSEGEALLLEYLSPEFAAPADPAEIASLPLPRAVEIGYYTVRKGDSISSIARQFGRSADSILSMNGIKNAKSLRAGTELKIPNMDGLLHVVGKGESLGSISKRYKVELTLLADANDLGSTTLKVGQSLFIPGAKLSTEELKRIYGTAFAWPVRGPISSWFGVRADPFTGVRRFHAGIDIVVNLGTPVKAAADGRVADLGYNANYGNYIILSHPDGSQTLYGHLSAFSVTRGQAVTLGKVIGKSGNSGYSTGPHLHFSLYRNGVAQNPLKTLK